MSAKAAIKQWTKEKIVASIRGLKRKREDLSYNHMANERAGLLSAANYHFGSWQKAVQAAGIDYDKDVRRIPKWTQDKIIETIKKLHKDGVDLSWTNVCRHPDYSGMAYAAIRSARFGSWDAALEAAGVSPSQVRRYESWDEKKVIRRIRERAKAGRELNSKAMQEEDCKLFNAALKRYKGWEQALRAARINPDAVYKRRRWSLDVIKQEIAALWRKGTNLAAPYMRQHHSALYSAACKYFGSWMAARRACGIRKNFRRKK
jgi:hypothetical protein